MGGNVGFPFNCCSELRKEDGQTTLRTVPVNNMTPSHT